MHCALNAARPDSHFVCISLQVSGVAAAGYAAGIVAYLAAYNFHDSPLAAVLGQLPHVPFLPGWS